MSKQKTKGAGHQRRAKLLAEWLETNAKNHSVVGNADTTGYVLRPGWMFRKQAS